MNTSTKQNGHTFILKISFSFMLNILPAVLFIFITGCSGNKTKDADHSAVFSLPRILQVDSAISDSLTFIKSECINDASTFFLAKFKFTDTVKINNNEPVDLASYGKDLIVSDSASLRRLRDSLTSDGLEIIPDYKMSIPINWASVSNGLYYPVYVVNETNSDKLFTARDRYVSAIQEAKDREGKWRPVESKRFDFTGNGRWALIIHPNEFALFIIAKYDGDYKTSLRVRMRVGDETYLSKAFEGTVNEKQFYLRPDSYQYNEYKKDKSISVTRRFLGAEPLEPVKN